MALYLVPSDNASSRPGAAVACRRCPAGSPSTQDRRYPSDMSDGERASSSRCCPHRAGWPTRAAGRASAAAATSSTRSAA